MKTKWASPSLKGEAKQMFVSNFELYLLLWQIWRQRCGFPQLNSSQKRGKMMEALATIMSLVRGWKLKRMPKLKSPRTLELSFKKTARLPSFSIGLRQGMMFCKLPAPLSTTMNLHSCWTAKQGGIQWSKCLQNGDCHQDDIDWFAQGGTVPTEHRNTNDQAWALLNPWKLSRQQQMP